MARAGKPKKPMSKEQRILLLRSMGRHTINVALLKTARGKKGAETISPERAARLSPYGPNSTARNNDGMSYLH